MDSATPLYVYLGDVPSEIFWEDSSEVHCLLRLGTNKDAVADQNRMGYSYSWDLGFRSYAADLDGYNPGW
jgi:hypothetical protein